MKTWTIGASGEEVRKVIDGNFDTLYNALKDVEKRYVREFSEDDWEFGEITIPFSAYKKQNPCVETFMKDGSHYMPVFAGYEIVDSCVTLQSDIPYEGKVVIR